MILTPFLHPKITSYRKEALGSGHSAPSDARKVPGLWMTSGSQATSTALAAGSTFTTSTVQCSDGQGLICAASKSNQPASGMVTQSIAAASPREHRSKVHHTQAVMDTFDMSYTAVPLLHPPGPQATDQERTDFLQQQLDSFGRNTPIFDDLLSLGAGDTERRQGGAFRTQPVLNISFF